jgi:uncharacterized protein YxjI
MTAAMYLPQFYVRQRFAMVTNRYEVVAANPDGSAGQLMGLAEQKKMALKEQVTFFSDDTKTRPVFAFKARKVMDLNSCYDITDEGGQQIGFFRKDFGASLLRSTFHVEGPGFAGTGQERNVLIAVIRRLGEFPLPVHFDFVDPNGNTLLVSERRLGISDTYDVSVPDQRVDFRVAAAIAVGLDALMSR